MGIIHGSNSISGDGLFIYFDAANSVSYPGIGTGTTWYDMSRSSYVGIMSNMTASAYTSGRSDYFTFDNSVTDDDAGHKQSIDIIDRKHTITIPPITWVSWLRRKQSCFNGTPIGVAVTTQDGGYQSNNYQYNMRVANGDKLRYYWKHQSSAWNYNPNITVPADEWVMCCLSVTSSAATFYMFELDGTIQTGTNITSHATATYPIPSNGSTGSGPCSIGKDPIEVNNQYFGGDIATVQVYSKALSQAELTKTFNATKERFLA